MMCDEREFLFAVLDATWTRRGGDVIDILCLQGF